VWPRARKQLSRRPEGTSGPLIAIGAAPAIFRANSGAEAPFHNLAPKRGRSMLITPAYAQAASPFGGDMMTTLLPIVLIFVIMYFLILRPQQKRVKMHQEMVKNLRRGDTVVTSGGLVGKVTKVVDDDQIEVEIADDVRVRQLRTMVAEVRTKGEPVKDASTSS
jgi:preprotein translocase subunit YajC